MWVGIRVCVFMMYSVITNPPQHWLLTRHRLQKEKDELEGIFRSVSSMGEKTVTADRRAEANDYDQEQLDKIGRQ